jgi:hypothetical protein
MRKPKLEPTRRHVELPVEDLSGNSWIRPTARKTGVGCIRNFQTVEPFT